MSTLLANPTAPDSTSSYSNRKEGTSAALQLLTFIVAFLVIVSRRPDALLHAQFYGEDGAIWFADAYNWGAWKVLFWTCNGYIQVLPRIVAALAVAVPVSDVPLVLNVVAIAIQVLPTNILISRRSTQWGPLRFRIALAVAYLAMPNTHEMMGIITNSQWILALCALYSWWQLHPIPKLAGSLICASSRFAVSPAHSAYYSFQSRWSRPSEIRPTGNASRWESSWPVH